MLQEILDTCSVRKHMNIISLIIKPIRDPTKCANYRSLPLISTDTKSISRSLSLRLETIIHHLIHPDQIEFIAGRHSSENTRRIFHLMDKAKEHNIPSFIMSLEAEKVFDQVDWIYLSVVLKQLSFG